MDLPIGTITEDEFAAYFRATETAFSHHHTDEELELERQVTEVQRCLVAVDGDRMVGTTGASSMKLTTPGGEVAMAGITSVGVLPTHRRRGILTSLTRRQLEDVRDGGEPIAGLWASEGSIYGRFGYGPAAYKYAMSIERSRAGFAHGPHDTGTVTLADKERAQEAMPTVYERLRSTRAGMLDCSAARWSAWFADLEPWRDGFSANFYAVHETSDGVDGSLTYRVKGDWSEGAPNGTVKVEEVMAETIEAYAALWRFALDIDLTGRIEAWNRPVDEPLVLMLAEPRRMKLRLSESLYLRMVDVPRALQARRYAVEGRLVFEVRDDFCPWVQGRYQLEGGPDGATCGPTDREPDLTLDSTTLAAAYLGGVGFRALGRVRRVDEATPGALVTADAMFATDPPPWCPFVF